MQPIEINKHQFFKIELLEVPLSNSIVAWISIDYDVAKYATCEECCVATQLFVILNPILN